uniref:Putative sulfate/bicarbonate/oxalate exchanger sat-1 n=2 Tax=Rhipicephalus microplus TaxID=6941 RepID=A0A6M2CQP7_RHIMP
MKPVDDGQSEPPPGAGPNMIRRLSKTDRYDLKHETPTSHQRPVFTQPHFDSEFAGIPKDKVPISDRIVSSLRKRWHVKHIPKKLLGLFPIISWVRAYNFKQWIISDIISGISVAIFHVPQSFGYSLLASVPAVNALYTAMFPMLMYTIFGTSRHLSIGAFAVVCMMTGAVVEQYKEEFGAAEVASTLMFFVGLYQLALAFLNLGGLSVFLSEQFVSGFTAGVSVHIGSSQLGSLFGIPVGHFSGPFLLIRLYDAFIRLLPDTHLPTLGMSACCIFLLLFVKLAIDPFVERMIKIPVPIEMILVIVATVVSSYFDLENEGFEIIGPIPNTFPTMGLPNLNLSLVTKVVVPALTIAIVSFAVTVSLGRIFARNHGYEVVPNQELLALGMSNFFGSFLDCFPSGASVPRSSIQDNSGGKSQLVSIINTVLIAVTLLYLGSYLGKLPVAVLASIIFVSLKKVFMQVRDFYNYWKISKIDGQVWLVTFFSTVFVEVQLGLVIGVVYSLLTLVYKIQRPSTCILGQIPNTDYFVPLKKYGVAQEVPGVKVFHFGGPIHFANAEFFRAELSRRTLIRVRKVLAARKKGTATTGQPLCWINAVDASPPMYDELSNSIASLPSMNLQTKVRVDGDSSSASSLSGPPTPANTQLPSHVVLDFSRVTFVDGSSSVVLKQVLKEYRSINIVIYIACCSAPVYSMLKKGKVLEEIAASNFYPSVHDAVMHVGKRENEPPYAFGTI